ncbi:hypothetical protein LTS18_012058 [Coniosporium uncinatum]|uniref:Uncharacterized protein n=1 Tax=Coniosporium uncinatum TaxID=93489 RepID=A0ACC3D9M4_9PEZI|nr:hypothetical protein LTS18_012058 [Coniosporium uncinatum]
MTTPKSLNYLITGSARGIGRGLSRLLLHRGHRVFLLDSNADELSHTTRTLQKQFPKDISSTRCNLRNPAEITASVNRASDFFSGHLDVLINNAANTGGIPGAPLADLTLEEWNASVETNLTAPMLMVQACLPMLKKTASRPNAGCVINVSSTRAVQSEENSEAYASTKAGLVGLTHSLAVSLTPAGVRVNVMLLGWINVANECKEADEKGTRWEEGLTEEDHRWHLTGRVGKVDDVWRYVEYLSEAEFVSGSEHVIDGGVTRRMVYPE